MTSRQFPLSRGPLPASFGYSARGYATWGYVAVALPSGRASRLNAQAANLLDRKVRQYARSRADGSLE
jgi:hypothetical protein